MADSKATGRDARPEPLIPADVDLRDLPSMLLDVGVLLRSSLWIRARRDPRLGHAAVSLWCEAWHEVPAGSLPNDDEILAELARCEPEEWQRIKGRALENFVECSDGRLYHPTVCEKALEAWDYKVKSRERTRKATEARANKGKTEKAFDESSGDRDDQRHDNEARSRDDHVTGVKEKGKEKGITLLAPSDEGASPSDPSGTVGPEASLPGIPSSEDVEAIARTCPHREILALWARLMPELLQHDPDDWKGTRAHDLRTRWREAAARRKWQTPEAGLCYFERLFAYCRGSAFLMGQVPPRNPGGRAFSLTLAWLVKSKNWLDVTEGKFH